MTRSAGRHSVFSPSLWRLVVALVTAAYGLGVVGYLEYDLANSKETSVLSALYHPLQLFVLHAPHLDPPVPLTLHLARLMAPTGFGLATILAFWLALRREFRRMRFASAKDHIVVFGLGEKGLEVVKCHIREHNHRVVVVEKDPDNPFIGAAEAAGALVIIGDMTERSMLEVVPIAKAKAVVAIAGDESANVEVALRLMEWAEERRPKRAKALHCCVHLTNTNLLNAFHQAGKQWRAGAACEVHFFDSYDHGAGELLDRWPLSVDAFQRESKRQPCLVVMGFGRMGRAVAAKAVQPARSSEKLLEVHVFDRRASLKQKQIRVRYPDFEKTCTAKFHEMETDSEEAIRIVERLCRKPENFVTMVLCCDRDSLDVELALRLLPVLKDTGCRAAVRLVSRHGLAQLLEKDLTDDDSRAHLCVFGMHRDSCCDQAYIKYLQ